ncbi:MAG: efflux RND transporter periplasmic adaptor subunit [Pseudomonadota bacterium]
MKKQLFLALSVLFLLASSLAIIGCSKKQEIQQSIEIRPVKTVIIKSSDTERIRHFPARVDANKKAEIAFRVSGKVEGLLVKEGDEVKKGEVIARLDPTDFKITVSNKNALFTRAKKDYLRGKKLVKEGHISKMDFDKLESVYQSTQADFSLAKQQLAYTELKAPFDGIIARRYIQNFEEIQSRQSIVTLNDNEILELKFDLPENLILSMQAKVGVRSVDESRLKREIPITALFQSQQNQEYRLQFKEISTKADEKTQTFSATYTMKRPENIIILPGMSATVKIDLSSVLANQKAAFYLPVTAVVADVNLKATIWVVDEKTMQVQAQSVQVASMKGSQIQITQGLTEGQRVVIAGVPFLYKGLKVSLMKTTEQARDNFPHQPPVMNQNKSSQANESSGSKKPEQSL